METQTETIEYEDVTVKVPKLIMAFLRAHEKDMGETAEEYIAYNAVGVVRADLDAGDVFVPVAEEIAREWNLNHIFKEIINDPYDDC